VGVAVPLSVRIWIPIQHSVARAEAYLRAKFDLDPFNRLATVHERYRQTGQRSDSVGRTVLQTVARLELLGYRVALFA